MLRWYDSAKKRKESELVFWTFSNMKLLWVVKLMSFLGSKIYRFFMPLYTDFLMANVSFEIICERLWYKITKAEVLAEPYSRFTCTAYRKDSAMEGSEFILSKKDTSQPRIQMAFENLARIAAEKKGGEKEKKIKILLGSSGIEENLGFIYCFFLLWEKWIYRSSLGLSFSSCRISAFVTISLPCIKRNKLNKFWSVLGAYENRQNK